MRLPSIGRLSGNQSTWEFGRRVRELIVGVESPVTLCDGEVRAYVNLDNAATTPAFRAVADAVAEFLEWYGSVHRGTGAKPMISSEAYERARAAVGRFTGADPGYHSVIFTSGTTAAINKLARTIAADGKPAIVLHSLMEHHSNLLPWMKHTRAECVGLCPDGGIDLDRLEERLRFHGGAVRLVAITGASNVTGLVPPVRSIARLAHGHGAELLVDGAQLVPHRPIHMGAPGHPECIDYLAFSGHKMHAPFGIGVLVGPMKTFEAHDPECVGGGAVRLTTLSEVVWASAPSREEAGTPNVVGAVALAKAIEVLCELDMERVAEHDREMRRLTVQALKKIPGIRLYAESAPAGYDQIGVVAFTAEQLGHSMLAAALGHEGGIGVRHGCFCADPYVAHLLNVAPAEIQEYLRQARRNDRSRFPGLVRVSTSLYNTPEEIGYFSDILGSLLRSGPRSKYALNATTGEYLPASPDKEVRTRFTEACPVPSNRSGCGPMV